MCSANARRASSSESDPNYAVDQKKRKRMISNRESARKSRARKQQYLDELINHAAKLENENGQMALQIDLISRQYSCMGMENTVLQTQLMELTERLKSMNLVLHFIEEFSGMTMDIPEIPNPLLKPWQLPCPWPSVVALPNMFQC